MIKFQTKILDTSNNNHFVPFTTNHEKIEDNHLYFELAIKQNNTVEKIGLCHYKIEENSLYIMWMQNVSPKDKESGKDLYKNVGSAIHEYIFKKSILLGKKGRVNLSAHFGAEVFHYKLGFRVEPSKCRKYFLKSQKLDSDFLLNLQDLVTQFDYEMKHKVNQSFEKIKNLVLEIFEKILSSISYIAQNEDLMFLVSAFLLTDINNILDKIFEHTDYNKIIETQITNNSFNIDIDAAYPMFLPDRTINERKSRLNISFEKDKKSLANNTTDDINILLNNSSDIVRLKNDTSLAFLNKHLEILEEHFIKFFIRQCEFEFRKNTKVKVS